MSFLGAVMQKLVHLCFGVFKTHQQYQHNYLRNAEFKDGILYESYGRQ